LLSISVLCAVSLGLMSAAQASTAGPNSPGTVVSDNSLAGAAWSDPGNAAASDDLYAGSNPPTEYLKATNFAFTVPPTAVILGISASVERTSAGGTVFDASVRIVKGGLVTGTDHLNPPSSLWPDTDAIANYGGPADLWGASWTAADINAAGFGIAIAGTDTFDGAFVDHITLTVTYSVCGDTVIEGSETCDDGNTNNGDCCSSTCLLDANGTACTSDGDVCTDDTCDGAGSCLHPNNTAPCDDGDPCTSSDVCSAGVCAGSGFCLDHFKCYQGKDLKNPKFVKQAGVNTTDQLINNQLVDVKKLKFVCAAVDVNGAGIENPNAYLSCYVIKAPQLVPRPNLQLSTQFQSSKLEAKKGKLICLPSSLSVLP
jgi:cysteine-rich repeat protein